MSAPARPTGRGSLVAAAVVAVVTAAFASVPAGGAAGTGTAVAPAPLQVELVLGGIFDRTPPAVPADVTVTTADGALDVRWGAVRDNDLRDYRVHLDGALVRTVAAGTTSARLEGLVNDRSYTVQVSARDRNGNESARSSGVQGTPRDLTPPPVPTGLAAARGDARVALTWDATADTDRVSTRVLRDGRQVTSLPPERTSFTDTGLVNDQAYAYALVAVDARGNASQPSPAVSATPTDLTAPAVPTGLVATPGDESATLTWDPGPDADLAVVRVLQDGQLVASLPAGTTAWTATGLQVGRTYTYALVAVDGHGNASPASAPVDVVPVDRTPPAVVTGTAVTALDRGLQVTWEGVDDAARYRVLLDGAPAGDVGAGSTSLRLTGLTGGRRYDVTVLAVDAAGNVSAPHAAVGGVPRDDVPWAPTSVAASARPGAAEVTWASAPEDDVVEHRVVRDGQVVAVAPAGGADANRVLVSGLEPGAEVELVVVAVDAVGQVSAGVSVRVTPGPLGPPPFAPTAPPATGSGTATGAGLAATRDGRWVVVSTPARLDPEDTNAAAELYLVDRVAGTSRRVAPLPASWRSTSTDSTNASAVEISADGRHLVLSTTARLVPADTNSLLDAYRLDLTTGAWELVSVPASGAVSRTVAGVSLPTGSSVYARSPGLALSADGRTVLFLSERADLVPGDRNGAADVFAKDMGTGAVTRVSVAEGGAETPWRATGPALEITPDGRWALFPAQASGRPLVLLRKDLRGGGLVVASTMTPPGATTPVEVSVFRDTGDVAVSDDGRYVAFSSAARPAAPRTSGSTGLAYRKDLLTGALAPLGTGQVAAWEHQLGLDPTGRYGFVSTAAALLPADTNKHTDHYRRDLGTGELRLVTSRADGAVAPARAGAVSPAEYGAVLVLDAHRVLVGTVLPLVTGDTNGLLDVYGRDLAAGQAGAVAG
ncbi:fibronectin type III domain-containing protein [Pseudokineococcus sp. 1T1Z-3]|uniref:fibronectin type III domain-containing protein n=1 Tax=Pseudokineococcus sp. 1T1Z-3 TaxID=3132745 RepID=UPI003097DA6A